MAPQEGAWRRMLTDYVIESEEKKFGYRLFNSQCTLKYIRYTCTYILYLQSTSLYKQLQCGTQYLINGDLSGEIERKKNNDLISYWNCGREVHRVVQKTWSKNKHSIYSSVFYTRLLCLFFTPELKLCF